VANFQAQTRPCNDLLAALPAANLAELLPKLSRVDLPRRHSLYVTDQPIEAVFFLEAGMVSLVRQLDDGVQAEVGIIGREGMLGIPLLHGVETSFTNCYMQLPGSALQMTAAAFRQEMRSNTALRALLLRYGEAQSDQVSQTTACNGRHGLEQRLARWLLMAHDRADNDELLLTQEFIATMLGVHRPSITLMAGTLQWAGLIRYAGGLITIIDRPNLEASACECYGAVRRRFERVMGITPAP